MNLRRHEGSWGGALKYVLINVETSGEPFHVSYLVTVYKYQTSGSLLARRNLFSDSEYEWQKR